MIKNFTSMLMIIFSGFSYAGVMPLKTELSIDPTKKSGWIDVRIENERDTSVCIDTKMIGLDGDLTASIFSISLDEKEIDYTGVQASRSESYKPNYIVLKSGQSIVIRLDLTKSYNFLSKGAYQVQHHAYSMVDCYGKNQFYEITSNKLAVLYEGK